MRWEERSTSGWWGYDEAGMFVAAVGLTVTAGGERRYWLAWRRDGTPDGVVVGRFDTAEEAMEAVERPAGP